MSEMSARLDLPYMQPAQAQKHITHNEALERLDLLVQLTVQGFGAQTPPALPQDGEVWALGSSPTGDWAGQPDMLAAWSGHNWIFIAPRPGWSAALGSDLRIWTGSDWERPALQDPENLAGIGVNTGFDAINRLSVSAPATLFTHEGADHRLTVNKAEPGDTASLLFQTGWSGRAEMGTVGDDDFAVKVSADGTSWVDALQIDRESGRVSVPTLSAAEISGTAVTQSGTDILPGRITKVGDFGLGLTTSLKYPLADVDADPSDVPNGFYRIDSTHANRPFGLSGTVLVQHYNSGEVSMLFMSRGSNSFVANRYYTSGWIDWKRLEPEYGSNSNGEYVRFAGGTQICWARVALDDVVTDAIIARTWVFPASFAAGATPLVSHTPEQGAGVDAGVSTSDRAHAWVSGTGSTSISLRNGKDRDHGQYMSGDFIMTRAVAVGRWF